VAPQSLAGIQGYKGAKTGPLLEIILFRSIKRRALDLIDH
jgi:hypothetical protein